jgi:hypothetical protein
MNNFLTAQQQIMGLQPQQLLKLAAMISTAGGNNAQPSQQNLFL